MKRSPVNGSSNIVEVGHDPDAHVLEIKFKDGGIYRYAGVDADKHAAMLKADSVGKFFHANVKGTHKHTKVDSEAQ